MPRAGPSGRAVRPGTGSPSGPLAGGRPGPGPHGHRARGAAGRPGRMPPPAGRSGGYRALRVAGRADVPPAGRPGFTIGAPMPGTTTGPPPAPRGRRGPRAPVENPARLAGRAEPVRNRGGRGRGGGGGGGEDSGAGFREARVRTDLEAPRPGAQYLLWTPPCGGWHDFPSRARPTREGLDLYGPSLPNPVRRANQDHFLIASRHRTRPLHSGSLPEDTFGCLTCRHRGQA
jgi:hypothetical protein